MRNEHHIHLSEGESCTPSSETLPEANASSTRPCQHISSPCSPLEHITGQSLEKLRQLPSVNSMKIVIRLMQIAAENHSQCAQVLTFARKHLSFHLIMLELHPESLSNAPFHSAVALHFLPAARNALYVEGRHTGEASAALSEISDPVCQFLCCSILFVDTNRDSFFKVLGLDAFRSVLSRESLPHILKFISFVKPVVRSLHMSPMSAGLIPTVTEPMTSMVRALSSSLHHLTVYLPDDQMVQVIQNADFALPALEELRIVLCGQHIREYNPPEASDAIHGFLEKIEFMCPKLKHLSWQNVRVNGAYDVQIRRLPRLVKHIVIIGDTTLVENFHSCVGLRAITIHAANIDLDKFFDFEREGGLPQLKRVNFVSCTFTSSPCELHRASLRLRSCVRTIMNNPLQAAVHFPVERLPELAFDLPCVEVVDLHLNTEADKYICELLGTVVERLDCLKSFTVRLLDSWLCAGNVQFFKQLFQCLIESKSQLEHLCMPNVWVCIDVLRPYLVRKGKPLKTLDVKLHSSTFAQNGKGAMLSVTEVSATLHHVRQFCPEISGVCFGDEQRVRQLLETELSLFGGCGASGEDDAARRMLDKLVVPFDRQRVYWKVYQDGLRGVCDSGV